MRIKVGLTPNPNQKQKKQEQEYDMCETKIQQDFITTKKCTQN